MHVVKTYTVFFDTVNLIHSSGPVHIQDTLLFLKLERVFLKHGFTASVTNRFWFKVSFTSFIFSGRILAENDREYYSGYVFFRQITNVCVVY